MYELVAESLLPQEHAQIRGQPDQPWVSLKMGERLRKEPIGFWDDAVGIEKDEEVATGALGTVVSPLRTAGPPEKTTRAAAYFAANSTVRSELPPSETMASWGSVKVGASVQSVDSMTFSSLNVGMMIEFKSFWED